MKRIFFILLVMPVVSLILKADDSKVFNESLEIEEIIYDYDLFQDKRGRYDCKGNVSLKIKIDPDIGRLLFYRSRHHLPETQNPFFGAVSIIDFNPEDNQAVWFTKELYWGTYFRVKAYLSTGESVYSPQYCINDYIRPDDWEKIYESAGVDDVVDETPLDISFRNGILSVYTDAGVHLSVYDLAGRALFNGYLSQPTEIPISANLIIVKYTTKNQTVTQKFIAK